MAVGKGSLARAAEAAEKAAEEKKNMTDEIMADALPEEQEKETMEENRAVLQETEKPVPARRGRKKKEPEAAPLQVEKEASAAGVHRSFVAIGEDMPVYYY